MGTDYVVRLSGKDDLSSTIKNVKKELNEFGNKAKEVDKIDAKFNRIIQSTAPLKRQLRDLQAIMAKMNMDGLSNTEQFTRIAQYAGSIRDAIGDASQAVNKFASDTHNIDASIQAFQGLAASASIATGVMALLNTENEDVARAIEKVQGALAVLNGIQSVANILNKDSALSLKVKSIMEKANTVAVAGNTTATVGNTVAIGANTVATKAWNIAKAVSKALVGDFTGLLLVGGAALITYSLATDKSKESTAEMSDETKRAENIQKNFVDTLSSTYSQLMTSYISLKNEWQSLSTEQQKIAWIKNNQTELKNLGAEVNGVNDAENYFNKNTVAVVNGFKQRAKGAAYMAKLTELYKQQMELIDQRTEALASQKDFDTIDAIDKKLKSTNKEIEATAKKVAEFSKTTVSVPTPKTRITSNRTSSNRTTKTEKPFDYNAAFNKNLQKNSEGLTKFVNDSDEKLEELKNKWNEVFTPKQSSFDKLFNKQNDTTTLEGIEDEMNMNDSMIESLNELIAKYKELGDISSVNQLTAQVEGLKKANDELGNSAVRISEKQKLAVQEQERYNEEMAKMGTIKETISSVESAFNGLGSAIGGSGGEMLKFGAQIMESTANIIPQIIKLIGAKQAEATASGTAEAAKLPFPANIGAIATIVAQIAAIFAALPKFADGGIVGGSSYSGDKLFARVNSGEMIFSKRQQRNLFNLIDNGNIGGGVNVTFKLRGADLYGSMANYSNTVSKIGKVTGIK